MPTLSTLRHDATLRLKNSGIENAGLDARLLLEAATGLSHAELLSREQEEITADVFMLYHNLIERRAAQEPVARILGWREFWGLRFALSPATLEPRPDSETLIEATLAHQPDKQNPYRILDLGTGTGCLLAALLQEYPNATGLGIDSSAEAVQTAQKNLAPFGSRATVQCGNWGDGLTERFDIIISNPPYIGIREVLAPDVAHYDPEAALFAGEDGLEAYHALLPQLPLLLRPDGLAILEIGRGQSAALHALSKKNSLKIIEIRQNLAEIPRAVVLSLSDFS